MMQVEVPTTLTTSPRRTPAPMASQWASKAPTGIGMPARRPSFAAHSGERWPAMLVRGCVAPADLGADAGEQRIDAGEELFGRQAAQRGVPHPLVAHGADAARDAAAGSVMPQRVAATMSQCSRAVAKRGALFGVVAQPVEQLGQAPLGGVDAAAPIDGCELAGARAAAVISAASLQARWSHQR